MLLCDVLKQCVAPGHHSEHQLRSGPLAFSERKAVRPRGTMWILILSELGTQFFHHYNQRESENK